MERKNYRSASIDAPTYALLIVAAGILAIAIAVFLAVKFI